MTNDQGMAGRPGSDREVILAKWRLATETDDQDSDTDSAVDSFRVVRDALTLGPLDAAERHFVALVADRGTAHDHVGHGDLVAAQGDWTHAAELYRRALVRAPADPVARVGYAQAMVATGRADIAVTVLEQLLAERDEPERRDYLASALMSLTIQARSMTGDRTLFIANERQLTLCRDAARRTVELAPAGTPPAVAAGQLLEEIDAGARWAWSSRPLAGALLALIALAGVGAAVAGGLTGSIPVVVLAALGVPLVFAVVVGLRRPAWRLRARALRSRLWQQGIAG